ncbi:PREDICTED: starch synthase 2, chloroplastic/amyloplastic-like [Nelumbo nucifera]|uniref:Starch synthase 2, chloroplastic/amyloplastic-like n=1 Tax=Nelumbo nucifera TaxID=4432 RepID=A0A1U8Q906_NELNU|nr:PREDICTED: starch synthase 2, chloroplastic/amyloplastic-like [Nelumbo nucifera]
MEDKTVKSPPLVGDDVTNIIVEPAKCTLLTEAGGLGDVAGALPKALARRGHKAMVAAPQYDFVFMDSPMFRNIEENIYGEGREDILKRMVLFGKAALEVLDCKHTRCIVRIHNIAHRGRSPVRDFCYMDLPQNYFKLYGPRGREHFNGLAASLNAAKRVVTISHGYA